MQHEDTICESAAGGSSTKTHTNEYHGHVQASKQVLVEGSQNHEDATPLKPENDADACDILHATQYEAERPVTAHSAYSAVSAFDLTDEAAALGSLLANTDDGHENIAATVEVNQFEAQPLLRRPVAEERHESSHTFAYSKAAPRHFDFVGKHKRTISQLVQPHPNDAVTEHSSTKGRRDSSEEALPSAEQNVVHGPTPEQISAHAARRLRKKKHRNKQQTATTISGVESAGHDQTIFSVVQPIEHRPDLGFGPELEGTEVSGCGNSSAHVERGDKMLQQHPNDLGQVLPLTTIAAKEDRAAQPMQASADETRVSKAKQCDQQPRTMSINEALIPTDGVREVQMEDISHQAILQDQISGRPPAPRVVKRKSKNGHCATAQTVQGKRQEHQQPEVIDMLQIVAHMVKNKEQTMSEQIAQERYTTHMELQRVRGEVQVLQGALAAEVDEKDKLTAEREKQSKKLTKLKDAAQKFKTFVDGLGTDLTALQSEALQRRRDAEALMQESQELKDQKTSYYRDLFNRSQRAAVQRHEAVERCQKAEEALCPTKNSLALAEKTLDEYSGMLGETRARVAELERQLAASASIKATLPCELRAHNNTTLDKLYELHAWLEERETRDEDAEATKQAMHAIVQALTNQHSSNADEIASIRSLLDRLSQSVQELSKGSNSVEANGMSSIAAIQTHLDGNFQALKASFAQHEDLLKTDFKHQEVLAALRKKLEDSTNCATKVRSQLLAAQTSEAALHLQHTSIQADLIALQKEYSVQHSELQETRIQLLAKTRGLDVANEDLKEKSDKVNALSVMNDALQRQLQDIPSQATDFGPERAELESKFRTRLEMEQRTMAEEADKLVVEQTKKLKDELLKKDSLLLTLHHDADVRTKEVDSLKASLNILETSKSSEDSSLQAELETWKELAETYKQKVEGLELSLEAAKVEANSVTTLKARYSNRLAELEKDQQELEVTVNGLREELCDAQRDAERQKAGIELLRASCNNTIEEAAKKAAQQVKALQERLTEAQHELAKQKESDDKFRASVETSWEEEEATHKHEVAELNARIGEIEAKRQAAMLDNEDLRRQLADSLRKFECAAERETKPIMPTHPHGPGSDSVFRAANASVTQETDCTLTGDRQDFFTNDGSTVEESQWQDPSPGTFKAGDDPVMGQRREPDSASQLIESDDINGNAGAQDGYLTQTVRETQIPDDFTSFAAFNTKLGTLIPNSAGSSSILSMPSLHEESDLDSPSQRQTAKGPTGNRDLFLTQDLPYEENMNIKHRSLDSATLSQEEIETYTYRKPTPSSNSGSKLVRNDESPDMAGSTIRRPGGGQAYFRPGITASHSMSLTRRVHTPLAGKSSSSHSNSPDFVNDTANGCKMSTYQPQSSIAAAKRRTSSQLGTSLIADPRLAGRQMTATTKRKADSEVADEDERKHAKRSDTFSSSMTTDGHRYSLRTQPSINDLPVIPSGTTGRRTSVSHTRMRNLAGGISRNSRGSTRTSRNGQYSARFSQELKR